MCNLFIKETTGCISHAVIQWWVPSSWM